MFAANDGSSFDFYRTLARQQKSLSFEDEIQLINRWRDNGDQTAHERLVMAHQPLIVSMSAKMKGYGVPAEDLISEATAGFINGIRNFDPTRGYRLSTLARWHIKAALNDCVLKYHSLVKLVTTENQKRLFFKLRRTKIKLGIHSDSRLSPDEIRLLTEELKVSEADLIKINSGLTSRSDASLNTPMGEDGDQTDWINLIASEDPSPFEVLASHEVANDHIKAVRSGLEILSDRERHIVQARHMQDPISTLEELGQVYGVSRERIRQLEQKALMKIKDHITKGFRVTPSALLAA